MAQTFTSRPPFDPAYQYYGGVPGSPEDIDVAAMRQTVTSFCSTTESLSAAFPQLTHMDISAAAIKDLGGNDPIPLTLFYKANSQNNNRGRDCFHPRRRSKSPAAVCMGGIELLLGSFPDNDDLVTATVEYRLAPEHPAATSSLLARQRQHPPASRAGAQHPHARRKRGVAMRKAV